MTDDDARFLTDLDTVLTQYATVEDPAAIADIIATLDPEASALALAIATTPIVAALAAAATAVERTPPPHLLAALDATPPASSTTTPTAAQHHPPVPCGWGWWLPH